MSIEVERQNQIERDYIKEKIGKEQFAYHEKRTVEKCFFCFDCRGEPDLKSNEISSNGYLKAKDFERFTLKTNISELDCQNVEDVQLFGQTWDKGSVLIKHLDSLFKMASKELMAMNSAAKLNVNTLGLNVNKTFSTQNSYFLSRKYCIELFIFIRHFIDCVYSSPSFYWILHQFIPSLKKKLIGFRKLLGKLTELPDYVYLHGCHPSGNKSTQPAYHLMHLHLDLRWLYLTLVLNVRNASVNVDNDSDSQFSPTVGSELDISIDIQNLIFELFDLSLRRFEKICSLDLHRKSPFTCTCIQELWVLIQLAADSLETNENSKKFWDYYGECVDRLNCVNENEDFEVNLTKTSKLTFSLWMLSNVAKLYNSQDRPVINNYNLLESIVKSIVNEELEESDMRSCLVFIEFICIKTWEPKVEPIINLWEYFYKKINSNFYVMGAPPISTAIISKNAHGLVVQIKSYIQQRQSVSDSFQHFLRIIALHLQRAKDSPRHWNVIKGRIFSKLSPPKLCSLNQIGEYHLVSLFLTLAISKGVSQLESKMIELFNVMLKSKNTVSPDLLKGILGFVILTLENNGNAGKLIQPTVEYINSLSPLDDYDIIRLYADEIPTILACNDSLTLGQHLLIDVWLSRYLFSSMQSDSSRLLETLLSILSRLRIYMNQGNPDQELIMFVEKLWVELISYLKGVTSQSSLYQVSDIAAGLAAISLTTSNNERFNEIFNLFIGNDFRDIRILRRFFCNLIENDGISNVLPNFNCIITKAWIRCSLLCSDINHQEMKDLTNFISKLPDIKNVCSEGYELLDCNEPVLMFFSCAQNKFVNSKNLFERQALREKVSSYVEGIEKWIKPIINTPRDLDQIIGLYMTVGNMIRMASPLFYVKSKPNTILQQLLDLMLLPVSIRNPDTKLPNNILQSVKASLHLFISGLFSLAPDQDHYIARMIKELLTVYVPRCIPTANTLNFASIPFINEFNSFEQSAQHFILDSVCNNFIKRKTRNPHHQISSALKFIKEIFNAHTDVQSVIANLLKATFDRICDIIMFCDDKHSAHCMAKEILKMFLNCNTIRGTNQLMDEIACLLTLICSEHLAWSSRQLFDLLLFVSSEAPDLMTRFQPQLLENIKEVEKKRGVGYDRNLRLGLERIESRLRAIKTENC